MVPFQQMGSLIKVSVRLNEQVTAPFYLDTAASSVVIPSSVAAALDLEPRSTSKTTYARTANGRVPMSVTKLASVELRGASVKDVDCLISDPLEVGLLGASFLRHFQVHGGQRLADPRLRAPRECRRHRVSPPGSLAGC